MSLTLEKIAETCHEANRAYCIAIGDTSQPTWAHAPDWQKASAINGVKHAQENPDAKPSDSHESWLKEKREAGWKYGPVKDPERKEHPCFVEYAALPLEQKAKDYIFLAIARTLGALLADPVQEANRGGDVPPGAFADMGPTMTGDAGVPR